MKKALMLLLALILIVAPIGCVNQSNGGNVAEFDDWQGDTLFSPDTELDIIIPSFIHYPYNENWPIWRYIREAVGGKLNITSIPSTEWGTKLSLMIASPKTLPDLVYVWSKFHIDSYALSGAYIPISDNLDKMPNFNKFWESIPEEEQKERIMVRLSGDGKFYYPPVYGTERLQNHRTWMYRKDIFEKHNIRPPETWDDLYDVCKELKNIYPKSYPFLYIGMNGFATLLAQWKPYLQQYVYYDYENDTWSYGATEEIMYDMVAFFRRLHEEGLVAPNFIDMNAKTWEELVSTDRGFIMSALSPRIDQFNLANRQRDPNYTWAFLTPPRANVPSGQHNIPKSTIDQTGYALFNTRDQERIDNAFKYLDWFYTDEAAELLSWGKEGETYEVVDGERRFILGEDENPRNKFGIYTYGTYQRLLPEMSYAFNSDEQNELIDKTIELQEDFVNPKFWMAFSDEEFKRREELRPAIEAYTDEMLCKFIYGQTPLSEWDRFTEGLKEMGVEELIEVHESAYARALNAIGK